VLQIIRITLVSVLYNNPGRHYCNQHVNYVTRCYGFRHKIMSVYLCMAIIV